MNSRAFYYLPPQTRIAAALLPGLLLWAQGPQAQDASTATSVFSCPALAAPQIPVVSHVGKVRFRAEFTVRGGRVVSATFTTLTAGVDRRS